MFVTPNLCHDMHDCSVAVGDAWVSAWVRMIVKSRAYRAGHTALFLTFDEGSNRVGHIPTVVVSPYTHAGTVSHRRYTPLLADADDGERAGPAEMPRKGLLGSRPFQGIPPVGGGRDSYCAEAIRRTSANSKRLPSRAAGRSPAAETTVIRRQRGIRVLCRQPGVCGAIRCCDWCDEHVTTP